ncbi:1-acylglycerol-3-phosphate O-acyltransferase [Rhizoctonia solani AG-1 IA]|uniref:1-acyl-sn-glycerol-3-phosphate acyltransferase n=1 Tax=Thanatephorus cucumeris (strain AG1-IA) TaxID=983506 RepID=L8WKD0_THACA|nr:1-acylglycerol-3-phosphate O-acyltransferase [Rhizoctonia solani AG-1 IA]
MSLFMSYLIKPLAYLSLPALVLRYLSDRSPIVKYYVRLTTYLSTLGVLSVWGVLVSIGMTAMGNRFDINYVVARSFYYVCGPLLGIDFVVEGEEHMSTPSAVYIGNHQTMLDILYLGRCVLSRRHNLHIQPLTCQARIFPKQSSIMAKKELKWSPLLGQYMALSGAVFVDRKNSKDALHALAKAGEEMKSKGVSLWVFPEGTRSSSEKPDLLSFKKGAFHLAVQAGVPIVPVVCENYWRLYRKGTLEEGTLKIKVLPPIPTKGLTAEDVTELAERTRESMLETLREISIPVLSDARESTPKPSTVPTPASVPESESIVDVRELLPQGKNMSREEVPTVSQRSVAGSESERKRIGAHVKGVARDPRGWNESCVYFDLVITSRVEVGLDVTRPGIACVSRPVTFWPKNEIPKRARPHPDPGLDSSVLSMYAVRSVHSGEKVYARAHTCAGTFDKRRTVTPDLGRQLRLAFNHISLQWLLEFFLNAGVTVEYASAAFPENTLASFEAAMRDGAEGIESVRVPARAGALDDVVLMFHDPSLGRTTDGRGLIREKRWTGDMENVRTVREPKQAIPTFEQTIELLMRPDNRHVTFNVDVKPHNDPDRLFKLMHTIISAQEDWETTLAPRILLGLWHPKFIEPAQRLLPTLRRAHIGQNPHIARQYFWESCESFSIDFSSLSSAEGEKFRKECKASGKKLLVWTVNRREEMIEAARWGVDAILTDVTSVWLELRKQLQVQLALVPLDSNNILLPREDVCLVSAPLLISNFGTAG